MRSNIIDRALTVPQNGLYDILNPFAKEHPTLGALAATPVVAIDITLETVKLPLKVIERLALTIINALGALFFTNCTIGEAIGCMEGTLFNLVYIPVALVMAPIKFIYLSVFPRKESNKNSENYISLSPYRDQVAKGELPWVV